MKTEDAAKAIKDTVQGGPGYRFNYMYPCIQGETETSIPKSEGDPVLAFCKGSLPTMRQNGP